MPRLRSAHVSDLQASDVELTLREIRRNLRLVVAAKCKSQHRHPRLHVSWDDLIDAAADIRQRCMSSHHTICCQRPFSSRFRSSREGHIQYPRQCFRHQRLARPCRPTTISSVLISRRHNSPIAPSHHQDVALLHLNPPRPPQILLVALRICRIRLHYRRSRVHFFHIRHPHTYTPCYISV